MATDEARRLLDALMGTQRNASAKEVQRRKGENFKDDKVCKFYLVGFCPMHERIFASTRRSLGSCNKIHSDALREEFEQHPNRKRYQERYESQLRSFLEDRIREADMLASSERKRALKAHQLWAQQLLNEAEELAEANDLTASREKAEQAEKVRQYAEAAERDRQLQVPEVCEVCGVHAEIGDEGHMAAHLKGKVHFGYTLFRQHLKELQEKRPVKQRSYPRREPTDSSRALLREANNKDRGERQEGKRRTLQTKERDGKENYQAMDSGESSHGELKEAAIERDERSKAKEKDRGVEERSARYDRKRKVELDEEEEERKIDGRREPGWRER